MAKSSTTWGAGKSANPGGRSKMEKDVRDLAREHSVAAITRLAWLMENAQSERTQAAAAEALLDRAWGRPAQAIIGGSEDDPPIQLSEIIIRAIDAAASGSTAESG